MIDDCIQLWLHSEVRPRKPPKSGLNQPRQCWIFYACYSVMAKCAVTSPINVGRATNTTPARGISPRYLLGRFEPPGTTFVVTFLEKNKGGHHGQSTHPRIQRHYSQRNHSLVQSFVLCAGFGLQQKICARQ